MSALIIHLVPRGRAAAFEAAGWQADERFEQSHHRAYSAMMSRPWREGEQAPDIAAECARLMGGQAGRAAP